MSAVLVLSSVHTTRGHGPCPRPVSTAVQDDSPVHVDTDSVYRALMSVVNVDVDSRAYISVEWLQCFTVAAAYTRVFVVAAKSRCSSSMSRATRLSSTGPSWKNSSAPCRRTSFIECFRWSCPRTTNVFRALVPPAAYVASAL